MISMNHKNSGHERRKKKGSQKSAGWRKERKKWPNFIKGMSTEYEKVNADLDKGSQLSADEDMTSKIIRDEAIQTWRFGSKLGISSSEGEQPMIKQLVISEITEKSGQIVDKVIEKVVD